MVDVMGVSKRNQNIHVEQIHRRSDTQVVDHLINHLTGYNGGSRFLEVTSPPPEGGGRPATKVA